MQTYQARERKSNTVNNRSHQSAHRGAAFQSSLHTPVVQARIQEMANNSSHVKQLQAYQRMADNSGPIQKKENKTGLPDHLKSGVERLSGMDLSDVRVHYNSSKPAQLHAMAYAQGTDIYLGPGQEKHLPHEAWHVVQQKQGRVQATVMAKENHNNQRQQKTKNTTSDALQMYTTVDIGKAGQDIQEMSPTFWRETNPDAIDEQEKYTLRYMHGFPSTNKVNISDAGNMAMNADETRQNTTFFLTGDLLTASNTDLKAAKSDFLLAPTGRDVNINHPTEGHKIKLIQVQAEHDKGEKFARTLKTRCDLFYKNITKIHSKFEKIFETEPEEAPNHELDEGRKKELDEKLSEMKLIAGDAFMIDPFGSYMDSDVIGWNVHYGGIVAVDGHDQVTLENYKRKGEARTLLGEEYRKVTGTTVDGIMTRINFLQNQLRQKYFFQLWAKWSLRSQITEAQSIQAELNRLHDVSKVEKSDMSTHHFKMYGPASKQQTFFDKWRGQMDKQKSEFKIAKAQRDQ
jgi:hypothetical protein